jgi:metal-sulfur cluster biosynthetic enzyme
MTYTKEDFFEQIKPIPDPELGVSIVDLGLVYDITMDEKGDVTVLMTLTSMGCPLFDLISEPIKEYLKKLDGVKEVSVDLTFDPPWSPEKMTEEGRVQLGFF